jgi:transaldolase
MRLFVDSASPPAIAEALAAGYIFGVTTNPTRLRRDGARRGGLSQLVRAAAAAGAQEIHLQVFAQRADEIVPEARTLHALDASRVVVKIPATSQGLAAAARAAAAGVPVTVTAAYTVLQVLAADLAGARYAAVYVNRLREAGSDPFSVIERMLEVIRAQRLGVQILAASLHAVEDLERLARLGVPAATLPVELIAQVTESPDTRAAVRAFDEDARYV